MIINDNISSSPELLGIDSKYILKLIKVIEDNRINVHSFLIARKGCIVVEGYFKPFDKDFMHRLYSSSKTYVSMAIGKLIGEGKLKLNDRIVDFFPELCDKEPDAFLKETTIEDILKMSVPMLTDTYYDRKYKDWAWTFFNRQESIKPSGTIFNYNTSGTFILCVLIEKITGKSFIEYLKPELEKIGVKDIWCVSSPDNHAWGGSGVVCTLRDYAKFAELIMNKGIYNGEHLLPEEYVKKATSKQIENVVRNNGFSKYRGYGYQTWITRSGFALLGMGLQCCFCFPDKDLLVAFNGDTQTDGDYCDAVLYNAIEYLLYDNISDTPLKESQDYLVLQNKLENLSLSTDFGAANSLYIKDIDGIKYFMHDNNRMGWKWFVFDFKDDEGTLTYENSRGVKKIHFGLGKYIKGTFPETHFYDKQVDTPANRELDCLAIAGFVEEKKILLRTYIIDSSLGNCFITFGFKDDKVGMYFHKTAEFFLDDYFGYAWGSKKEQT